MIHLPSHFADVSAIPAPARGLIATVLRGALCQHCPFPNAGAAWPSGVGLYLPADVIEISRAVFL
jgi:hypothetical protein